MTDTAETAKSEKTPPIREHVGAPAKQSVPTAVPRSVSRREASSHESMTENAETAKSGKTSRARAHVDARAKQSVPTAVRRRDASESMAETSGSAKTPLTRAHVGARAKQSVPPAVRRRVLHRDHGCCRVPGCRNAMFLDLHHIDLRSEGGSHCADNLLTVCGAHHRALHRGELVVEGASSESARFRHADGAPYGKGPDPFALEVQAKVFGALRNLGFREGEVRRVLAELRAELGGPASAGEWLRAAVQRLTSG